MLCQAGRDEIFLPLEKRCVPHSLEVYFSIPPQSKLSTSINSCDLLQRQREAKVKEMVLMVKFGDKTIPVSRTAQGRGGVHWSRGT